MGASEEQLQSLVDKLHRLENADSDTTNAAAGGGEAAGGGLAGTAANGGAPVRVSVFVVASLALKVAAAQVVAVRVVVVVSSTILLVGEDSRRWRYLVALKLAYCGHLFPLCAFLLPPRPLPYKSIGPAPLFPPTTLLLETNGVMYVPAIARVCVCAAQYSMGGVAVLVSQSLRCSGDARALLPCSAPSSHFSCCAPPRSTTRLLCSPLRAASLLRG